MSATFLNKLVRPVWISFVLATLICAPAQLAAKENPAGQFILLNLRPGSGWNRGQPELVEREAFTEIKSALPDLPDAGIRVGIGYIFSYFRVPTDEPLLASLRRFLKLSEETDTPVYIQLDGENWWESRPDLWNWWDPVQPGYDPANRENVEWSGWSSDDALKIAWRNWGRQLRVLPPPNLMSARYRQECHKKMALLIPVILDWWKALPAGKKELLVGVKVGWESSIGVNAWYYPNGNDLLASPAEADPQTGLKADDLPSRGVAQTGYAAVKTAGLRTQGRITEGDLAEVVRRHLENLSRQAARLGVPREKLFTHVAGWKEGELLYQTAVNEYSCPGWSFYQHARDPSQDVGVQSALKKSDAPFWAATEWLFQGGNEVKLWREALEQTLADKTCRLLCIYNWDGIQKNEAALQGIRETLEASVGAKPQVRPADTR